MSQTPHRRLLVQAPVRALDPDGLGVLLAGTIAFALASGWLWLTRDALAARGQEWWLATAVTGTVLGLLATVHASVRRRRRSSGVSVEERLVDADGVPDRTR